MHFVAVALVETEEFTAWFAVMHFLLMLENGATRLSMLFSASALRWISCLTDVKRGMPV